MTDSSLTRKFGALLEQHNNCVKPKYVPCKNYKLLSLYVLAFTISHFSLLLLLFYTSNFFPFWFQKVFFFLFKIRNTSLLGKLFFQKKKQKKKKKKTTFLYFTVYRLLNIDCFRLSYKALIFTTHTLYFLGFMYLIMIMLCLRMNILLFG